MKTKPVKDATSPRLSVTVVAASPLLLLIDPLRHLIESRMLWHMMVEFPWLLLAGSASTGVLRAVIPRARGQLASFDAQGLFGAVLVACVSALWMVPAALDVALLEPPVAAFKVAGWWWAGAALASSWARMALPLRMFLLGNLAWMLLTAGFVYSETDQRLCVNYLLEEQVWSGRALMGVAGVLLAFVIRQAVAGAGADHAPNRRAAT